MQKCHKLQETCMAVTCILQRSVKYLSQRCQQSAIYSRNQSYHDTRSRYHGMAASIECVSADPWCIWAAQEPVSRLLITSHRHALLNPPSEHLFPAG